MTTTAAAPSAIGTIHVDADALRAFWQAVVRPGDVHEVRGLETHSEGPRRFFGTVSGYFDNEDAFVAAVASVSGRDAEGVYLSLNPVNPALLARGKNRLQDRVKATTSDQDVLCRTTLLVDVDPVRPSGISATDAEREAALAVRDQIRDFLTQEAGWPSPLACTMSGNGGGLLYRLELPNDPASATLIQRVLQGLNRAFTTPAVKVDTSNYNAARLTKIIGTIAAKGDPLPDRPWRCATGTFPPDASPVSREALASVAALLLPDEARLGHPSQAGHDERPWDIRDVLTRQSIAWKERPKDGYTVLTLDRCLTSPDHTDGAAIFVFPSGAVGYKCHHDRCAGKGWGDARSSLGLATREPRPIPALPPGPATPVNNSIGGQNGQSSSDSFLPPKRGVGNESNFCPVSATDLLAEASEPMPWVWESYLAEGTLNLLVSYMKVGKSTLAYPLAIAIARGRSFLDYATRQGAVLILAVEEHPRDIKRRLEKFGLQPGDPVHIHRGRLANSPGTFKVLREFITNNNITLVILDTLPKFWSVEDENDNAQVMREVAPFLDLARDTGAVVLLLHHERKSGGEDGRSIRGGGALFGLVDQALLLERRQGVDTNHRTLRALGRYDETPPELIVALEGNAYRKLGTPEETDGAAKAEVVWTVLSDDPQDIPTIAKKATLSPRETRTALESFDETRVRREGKGVRGNPHTYRRATPNSILPQPSSIGEETNSAPDAVAENLQLEEVEL